MKTTKKIFSLVLALAFVLGLTMPSFAANAGKVDPSEYMLPDSALIGIDVESFDSFSNGTGEGIAAPPVPVPDSSRTDPARSLAFASDYATLYSAITGSSASTIVITANITMTDCITITRDINFISGASGSVTLTSAAGKRHFNIEQNADLSFSDVILDGNSVSGGIYIDHCYVTIYGANIQNCYGDAGGAIFANNQRGTGSGDDYEIINAGSLSVSNSTFTDNASDTMGGAIASIGPMLINDSTLSGNHADESGGAIYMLSLADLVPVLTVSRTIMEENEADHFGGGVFAFGATVNMNNSLISTNTASAGGGLYSFICTTTLSGSYVEENSIASTNNAPPYEEIGGAGIHASGKLTLLNSSVSDNVSSMPFGFGAGVLMVDDALFGNPNFTYHYYGTEELSVTNGYIDSNENSYLINGIESSVFYGGGVAALGVPSSFNNTMDDSAKICYNKATFGGGIYSTSTVNIYNAVVGSNRAYEDGGGINSTGTVNVTGGTIGGSEFVNGNSAGENGGGIYSTGTVNISGGMIGGTIGGTIGNISYGYGNSAGENGGGIYSTGIVNVSGGTIGGSAYGYGNFAGENGGGIYSTNTVIISGGTIKYNIADLGGAGVYGKYVTFSENGTGVVEYNTTVVPSNISTYYPNISVVNSSTGNGGGVYVDNGSFNMTSGYIRYNVADVSGGGVYLKNSSFNISDYSRIYGNTPDDLAFGF